MLSLLLTGAMNTSPPSSLSKYWIPVRHPTTALASVSLRQFQRSLPTHACFPDPTHRVHIPAPRVHSPYKADQPPPLLHKGKLMCRILALVSANPRQARTPQLHAKNKGLLWQLSTQLCHLTQTSSLACANLS